MQTFGHDKFDLDDNLPREFLIDLVKKIFTRTVVYGKGLNASDYFVKAEVHG